MYVGRYAMKKELKSELKAARLKTALIDNHGMNKLRRKRAKKPTSVSNKSCKLRLPKSTFNCKHT